MLEFLAETRNQFEPLLHDTNDNTSSSSSRASIYNSTAKTRLATQEQAETLPLANKATDTVNVARLKERLNPDGLKQWDDAFNALCKPDEVAGLQPNSNVPVSHGLSKKSIERVVATGACRAVTESDLLERPTKGSARAFFVLEEKLDDNGNASTRARMILHTKAANAALTSASSSFSINVHMYRSSYYTPAIAHEAAIVADIYSGFTHVDIPVWARSWFRFRDDDGTMYEQCRLPMGHHVSVQLMEVITLAIVGSPIVCKPEYTIRGIRHDGFVDDLRAAGPIRRLEHAKTLMQRTADHINVRFKEPLQVTKRYTYLGVVYDHDSKIVSISDKTLRKLPEHVDNTMKAGDLYRTVSRLIFCSGPLEIPLGRFYFSMKHTTALCNKINRGLIDDDTTVSVPSGLQRSLSAWIELARSTKSFANHDWNRKPSRACTLFTDASLSGWGAFLTTSDNAVYIVGGAWRDAHQLESHHISWLEARAVKYAFQAFRGLIRQHDHVKLRIDNTSVAAAMARGRARAAELQVEVIEPIEWLKINNISVDVAYVTSQQNRADIVSRTPALQTREVMRAG